MQSRRTFLGHVAVAPAVLSAADDLCSRTLESASDLLRSGKCSATDLTQACLQRIQSLNSSLNAFITITADEALRQARTADAELRAGRRRGPLHGIPVALKDLFDTAGVRTTAGSRQYFDRTPRQDAEVVAKLKAGGAVILGKLNMDEFAYNYTGETSCFGPARNPWDRKRSPGGSSGGSGVAVAAGMCFCALGSDTGGSIRLPAAFCGITGLKPSYGLVSTSGVTPLAWSLDHVGPMCRTAEGASRVLAVMTGGPTRVISRAEIRKLRVGVPRTIFCEGLHADTAAGFEEVLQAFGRITAGVRDVVLPPWSLTPEIPELPLTYNHIITAEALAFHEEMLRRSPDRYHPGTWKSIEGGRSVSTTEYIRARRNMDELRTGSARLFQDADVLITPTAPGPAFELGKPGGLVYLRNSAPWNMFGLPAISVPCGFTSSGLPLGVQITAPAGRDDIVLATASAWQQATDWHTKRPRLY